MEVSKIAVNGTETIPQAVNMKARNNNAPEAGNEEKSLKDALTDPKETVGRSQVQFKGSLSSKDLNAIAGQVARENLDGKNIITLKKALSNVLEKEKIANLKELRATVGQDENKYLDFIMDVVNEAYKINPNADLDKIGTVAATIF